MGSDRTASRVFRGAAVTLFFCLGVTMLPQWQVDHWLVRVWDFPRLQILAVTVAASGAALISFRSSAAPWRFKLITGLVATVVLISQAALIGPYTPLWKKEVVRVTSGKHTDCVRILLANVLMSNDNYDAIRQTILDSDADIVFVVENDRIWSKELESIAKIYPEVIDYPLDNTYGLLFMTRLPKTSAQVNFLTDEEVPSITALLKTPGTGQDFFFYGIHPKPPLIGQSSTQRDRELIVVSQELRRRHLPAIVGGDLNDVAWSHTTRLFRRVSRALDPRIGRGTYSSFHAQYPMLRWPLDHVFHSEDFELKELKVLADTGSDHFPLLAELCYVGAQAEDNGAPDAPDDADRAEIQEAEQEMARDARPKPESD